ncbi:MAG: MBL fold metallo-hydrolase, partial [Candidatus Rokubacteria bacterium]|nr:MBL fold metallo-hydrolase [Candidatus Rokubacteria bacterium]
HGDHNNAALIRGHPVVLRGLTEGGRDWNPIRYQHKDVSLVSVPVYHDEQQGRLRGKNTMIAVELGGLRVAHLSDMGHLPTEAQYQALGRVEVLLVPVGGHFSIDGRQAREIVERLRPRIAIPIHSKTAATATWPIEDERAFVEGYPRVRRLGGPRVTLALTALPSPHGDLGARATEVGRGDRGYSAGRAVLHLLAPSRKNPSPAPGASV